MEGTLYEKKKTNRGLVRSILIMVGYVSIVFSGFIDNSTMYVGVQSSSSIIQGHGSDIDDNYKYNLGLRKIGLFPYQDRGNFYKGDENELSDNAILGAVNGWEYLFNYSSSRNQGIEFIDQDYWFKWSNNWFVTKAKYINKESRDLEFFDYDARFRLNLNRVNFTIGGAIRMHPTYGHPAIDDYDGYWWDLAYVYGYTDYMIPLNDLNENGIIDDYYVWIETDPDTEEGYWIYYYEGINYYWEDANSNAVADSDAEFLQYHYPNVVQMYNEDNKVEKWQGEIAIVIGIDVLLGNENYYSHIWLNAFPKSVGLTDKAYTGDDMQYDLGALIGAKLTSHVGVFLEGSYLNYYGRNQYTLETGINYKF